MKNGFRQQKQASKKDQLKQLAQMVQNLQMAVRVMQMGLQQFGQSFQRMDADIGNAMGVLNDIQYRTLAMVQSGKFNKEELDKVAEGLKLEDYEKASDKEDKERGYTVADVVAEDSVVILTSECKEDKSKSVFRTKFKLDESGNPEAQEKLKGLKVGDKAELKIGKDTHEVTVLGVRTVPTPPAKEEPKDVTAAKPAVQEQPKEEAPAVQ
jgi:hypothetical protein